PWKRSVALPPATPCSTKRPEESVVVERLVPTTVTLMPPAVENAVSSALEAVAAVCTVPWMVAPLDGDGEVGDVADELHPIAPMMSAMTGSEMSARKAAFIENLLR